MSQLPVCRLPFSPAYKMVPFSPSFPFGCGGGYSVII